jgi:hypothetical protein
MHPKYLLALCAGSLFLAASASADVVNLSSVSAATAVDNGPEDGVFDFIDPFNLGAVDDNGFTSFRTALEFDLSALPSGSTVHSAQLTLSLDNFEGVRSIHVHGYAGDGTVNLGDFSLDALVGTATVSPTGAQLLSFDVTGFVSSLEATGRKFAGFDIREEPVNTANFLVMRLDPINPALPVLIVDATAERVVDIDIKPASMPNSINPGSQGKVPVAILSSSTFAAPSEVDATSLTFGRTGSEASLAFCSGSGEDVNGDGLPDLVCHFNTQATGFLSGDTQGVLKGRTLAGAAFEGTDSVRIVQ